MDKSSDISRTLYPDEDRTESDPSANQDSEQVHSDDQAHRTHHEKMGKSNLENQAARTDSASASPSRRNGLL
jgi:hypothetical protein